MFFLCGFSQCFVYILNFFFFFYCGNVIRGVWKVQGSFPVFVGVFLLTCIRKHYFLANAAELIGTSLCACVRLRARVSFLHSNLIFLF